MQGEAKERGGSFSSVRRMYSHLVMINVASVVVFPTTVPRADISNQSPLFPVEPRCSCRILHSTPPGSHYQALEMFAKSQIDKHFHIIEFICTLPPSFYFLTQDGPCTFSFASVTSVNRCLSSCGHFTDRVTLVRPL